MLELVVASREKERDSSAKALITVVVGGEAVGLGEISDGFFKRVSLIEIVTLAVSVFHLLDACVVCVNNRAKQQGQATGQPKDERAEIWVCLHQGLLVVWAEVLKKRRSGFSS